MWIFTPVGFFSVVDDLDNAENVLVRARDRETFQRFIGSDPALASVSYTRTPGNDYLYRASINRLTFAGWMAAAVNCIDYSNFKGECERLDFDDEYLHAMYQVWRIMADYQIKAAKRERENTKRKRRGRKGN